LWEDYELDLDVVYLTARIIELGCVPPTGFNPPAFKQFLVRIAGDKDSNVSAKRLGEWLRRNSGRVVRMPDGRRLWLVREQTRLGRAGFRLSEVK
jgi:hypothetical protein